MVCIYCNSATSVVNSRRQRRSNQVWRRRKCLGCSEIFTTLERIELEGALLFVDKHSKLQPFSRDTLLVSIYESCKHRRTASTDAAALTEIIIARVLPHQRDAKVERDDLIQVTRQALGRFDKAAATSYTAYHPL